jgi:hypothetical protein
VHHTTPFTAAASAVILLGAAPLFAQGGPPLITDDPDTPGPRHWEINLSMLRERMRHERRTEEPRLDVNYGVGRRIQLKLETPWVARTGGESGRASGLGDTTAGMKWRFLGQEHRLLAWSVYPQYQFSPSSASVRKGVAEDGHQLLLPSEVTVEVSGIEFNLEVGRNFVSRRPSEWVYGVATEGRVAKRLELLGEVHGVSPAGAPTELIVNGGARGKITRRITLMLALGRALHGSEEDRPRLLVYAGVQFNLPEAFDFDGADTAARGVRRAPAVAAWR